MTKHKFLIRFYLLGILEESTNRAEKFVERFGGEDTQIRKNREVLDQLDSIFKPLSSQVMEILRLRFVENLEVHQIAKQLDLTHNKVEFLCSELIQGVKKIAKSY